MTVWRAMYNNENFCSARHSAFRKSTCPHGLPHDRPHGISWQNMKPWKTVHSDAISENHAKQYHLTRIVNFADIDCRFSQFRLRWWKMKIASNSIILGDFGKSASNDNFWRDSRKYVRIIQNSRSPNINPTPVQVYNNEKYNNALCARISHGLLHGLPHGVLRDNRKSRQTIFSDVISENRLKQCHLTRFVNFAEIDRQFRSHRIASDDIVLRDSQKNT